MSISAILTKEFDLLPGQADSLLSLLKEGNTIPFIARYRKEWTGGLSDTELRELSERITYLEGMAKRRETILHTLREGGLLTEALSAALAGAKTLAELEDIYRPYKPKRRTRAMAAIEAGLEPLAKAILLQEDFPGTIGQLAFPYVRRAKGILDVEAALQGARDIIAEMVSDDATARAMLREQVMKRGLLEAKQGKAGDSVYRQYYQFSGPISTLPGHRVLAINRGEREGFLKVRIRVDMDKALHVLDGLFIRSSGPLGLQVTMAVEDAWERLLYPALEREMRTELTERAEKAATKVFATNLRQLLMQPPLKGHVTLGVDPGFRTGCKLAVIGPTGDVLETGVAHFTLPNDGHRKAQSAILLKEMITAYGVTAIAIGNGTGAREAEQFIASLLQELPEGIAYAVVSEAGASVYSASKLGAEEFPDYDVSLRSAISIARRMQDPLAELVKIDPKAIGVGQYQHDMEEKSLGEALSGVVEACVNTVGVEISTASAALLAHVAGIGPALAHSIVAYRGETPITSRTQLKKVPKLGKRAFEQCAGFIRILDSKNPLDATAVHPESYKAAEALLARLGYQAEDLRGGDLAGLMEKAEALGLSTLAKELSIGLPTLRDILAELMKPGRDPREDLPPPLMQVEARSLEDLQVGMEATGTIRNVTDFGVFVDIGVHQDGLVHISHMTDRFIRHPSEVCKVGDVVKVWVLEVDPQRKRLGLTMRKDKLT